MSLSQEAINEFKDIYKKEYDKELSDAEASEAAHNLFNFTKTIWDIAEHQARLKHRIKKEPDGFPVDGHYSCIVCCISINPETGWYDRWYQKCKPCKNAVRDKTIPTFVCEHRDSYYSMWHLKDKFGIKTPTAKKLIKEGKLKARVILTEDGKPHDYIFLKKENPDLIDPDRHTPARKSYDRHRDKMSKIWAREETKKVKAEFRKKISR
ncbi:MAG: hypothetical protein A3B11_00865 [Candidatus Taylorbacteria bacterium RIFCSPLOWO2_01_FULL_44_26]|uniref:Uncharacterized protein n=2 Tax=Parcubacteria group TaxID=1794811 RepID=A0A1G2N5Q1_9BACT|nr:MAG: hypothetical protein A2647_01290 [Candidatus Nomurabacteria bacterium RIFCSPHIGHO2_01_FULL_40_24b]OHA31496.1 MAG: hypothetical protein A3B11_00865 [Candidatus Taylorbacteria bacterium RIFCSPLOWO2_01_FULL_44_26]